VFLALACDSTTSHTAAPVDGSTDASTLADGGDAGSDPPEAATDGGGACVPARNDSWSWVLLPGGGPSCGTCAQTQCCDALTTCDDGTLDNAGFTHCGEYLKCIVQYVTGAGAFHDGSADASPDFDAATSACSGFADATEQGSAEAVLGCIRTNCSSECSHL
jgi:hypothetical protein